jgi:hypothetical protein
VWKDGRISEVLVGAVGIENNNAGDLKDLRGMRKTFKSLKRDDRERKEILIAPLKLPRFSEFPKIPDSGFSKSNRIDESRLRAQISRHGWRAD